MSTQLLELDKVFIEHPNMRKYFNGRDVKAGDPDYDAAASIADYNLDLIDNFYAFQPHLDPANYDLEAWENFFVASFKNSPVMCHVLKDQLAEFGRRVREVGAKSCGFPI